jgi:hypothetical protein
MSTGFVLQHQGRKLARSVSPGFKNYLIGSKIYMWEAFPDGFGSVVSTFYEESLFLKARTPFFSGITGGLGGFDNLKLRMLKSHFDIFCTLNQWLSQNLF